MKNNRGKSFLSRFFWYFIVGLVVLVLGGVILNFLFKDKTTPIKQLEQVQSPSDVKVKAIDFSTINSEFLFSARIPKEFEVQYIPKLKAINIYNPSLDGQINIEKSQLYISFFKANKFLTLSTVDITRRDKVTIKGHEAILYEIAKKDGLSDFSGQPNWRNFKHQALDVRLNQDNPSYFYSFAYVPDLEVKIFNDIINSLIFFNQGVAEDTPF